jgi:capsular polysaccharide export protein
LDHGIEPHGHHVAAAAARLGVSDRVFFADDGHFPTLIAKADGVITVNSTGGLSAIEAGLPTIVLGDALYDIEGLTHRSGLASFWSAPERPDPSLFEVFRAVVMASTQINGAFSTRHGVRLSAPEAVRRLLTAHAFQ